MYLPFRVQTGDANQDGAVNFRGLLILAQNYKSIGRTFSQGNFDYSTDGLVGFDDLLLLAQRYGQSLLAASPPPALSLALGGKRKGRETPNLLG
jgi:hypothetical protein